jgi:hypothetical protein
MAADTMEETWGQIHANLRQFKDHFVEEWMKVDAENLQQGG